MRGVYVFAGVMIVIGATALYFLVLAKLGSRMFNKKEKDEQPR